MQALVLSAPRTLTYESVPDPTPASHEAVVEVAYAGICGTDVELFINEDMHHYTQGYARLPIVPGHEWSGTVVEVGRDVTHLVKGDRVIVEVAIGCGVCRHCNGGYHNVCTDRREVGIVNQDGGFAQYACVPAKNLRKTGDLPYDQAALSEPTAVTLNGCRQGRIGYADRVLVVGAGPIGLLALQCARALGAAQVDVIDRSAGRLELARSLGAEGLLNGSDFGPDELPEQARARTGGEGYDVILECAGAEPLFGPALAAMAPRGRLVVVGCFGEKRPRINPDFIMGGQREIVGAVGGGSSYMDAIRLIQEGKVKAPPLISHRLALSEGPKLLCDLARHKGPEGALKILMHP